MGIFFRLDLTASFPSRFLGGFAGLRRSVHMIIGTGNIYYPSSRSSTLRQSTQIVTIT